jgi:broad specificity phosphatase PhoE
MKLFFVRHGHYDKAAHDTAAARKLGPLSPAGEEDARTTGMYLAEHGFRPDLALHTATERTRQTAQLVLEELGLADRPLIDVGSAFRDLDGMARKLAAWKLAHNLTDASVVLLVGHGNTQDLLRRCWTDGAPPPRAREGHAAALEVNVRPDGRVEAGGFFVGRRKP